MAVLTLSILVLTLIVVGVSLLVSLRATVKPKLRVRFADEATAATHKMGEEVNLALHIRNVGNPWPLPSPVMRGLTAFVYVPLGLELVEMKTLQDTWSAVLEAPHSGIFKGMRYTGGPTKMSLFCGEVERLDLRLKLPQNTGQYDIKVALHSVEGDLGISTLRINCV